ncbi:MAG: class I SAM-dependent methyltransferase [Actinomycetota bacterium]
MRDDDLIAYYRQDAPVRDATPESAVRAGFRRRFTRLLAAEGRRTVIEAGCGPGGDGRGFTDAGLDWTGFDLTDANAAIAGGHGLRAVTGSLFDPPFRPGVFDAVWCMSTLVHVADADLDRAMTALRALARPGAPFGIGLWEGPDLEWVVDEDRFDPPRFFSRRNGRRARELLGAHGTVEHHEVVEKPAGAAADYQFLILRTATS